MDNFANMNEWRLTELMDRVMTHHYRHDFAVTLEGWDSINRTRYEVHLDNTLLYVERVHTMDFYPCGYFGCGACSKMSPMSHKQHGYFDYNNEFIICQRCYDKNKHDMVPSYPRMCAQIFSEPSDIDNDSFQHINFIDKTSNGLRADTQRRIAIKRAERAAAANPNLIFLGGRSVVDIRNGFLAKRVIRAFRRYVILRTRAKIAYVIATVTAVDADTAHGIASHFNPQD